jgi:hypothetical protein
VYDPYYLSDSLEDAFEVVTINVKLPPLISGHTITRANNSETDINIIHTGDIVHFSFANSSSEIEDMDFRMDLPEAFNEGESPTESNDNSCWKYIEPNLAGVFDGSWIAPSAAEIYTHCHGDAYNQYSGDWIFDQSIARSLVISVDDIHNNSIPSYYSLTLAAQPTPAEAPPTEEPTPPKKTILEESTPQQETQPTPPAPTPPAPTPPAPTPPAPTPPAPTPPAPTPPAPTPPAPTPPAPTPPAPTPPAPTPDQKVITPEPVVTVAEKPIKSSLVAKACIKAGVWIFTKDNLLQICDTELKIVLAIPACTGKKATPTYPWLFKPQRFKPGYSSSQSGQKLYYSVFFFKGLAIAGVDKVSSKPCSTGSVFIEKKHAKQVYDYIAKNKSLIWVKS